MTTESALFWQSVLSFSGILILAVPVLSLDARRKTLQRVRTLVRGRSQSGDRSTLDRIGDELLAENERGVSDWRRIDRLCLWTGYLLLFAGSGWRVISLW